MAATVRTRLLILSDTHGHAFSSEDRPTPRADVALHCGDLTDGSQLDEFRSALDLLASIDAPLKLVIAGNHDFTMDLAAFQAKLAEAVPLLEPDLVAREYETPGQARQLFDEARHQGIVFLDEGIHRFTLDNGARLSVHASPDTPALGAWGFQCHPNHGRAFAIEHDTDVVMTHGPSKGVLDVTYGGERAGCPDLFAAVARARSRIHCFGHIHEGWGARVVAWRDGGVDPPSHFTAIDNESSVVVATLATLRPHAVDSDDRFEEKRARLETLSRQKCATTSHCARDRNPLQAGKETLFVNAAVTGHEDIVQRPWLVDIELPKDSAMEQERLAQDNPAIPMLV